MGLAPLALAAVVLLVGCSDSKKPKAAAWHVRGSTVRGDVDGDNRLDAVAVEDRGSRSCRFRVRADTGGRVFTAPLSISACGEKPAETFNTTWPSVLGLAAIDNAPGLEIVVDVGHGASTSFAAVFLVLRGHMRRLRLPAPFYEGQFDYEGSVTHFDVIDCVRPGVLVASGYGADLGPRVLYGRAFYRVDGDRLRFLRAGAHGRLPAEQVGSLQRYPEFREPQPFPSCMKIRSG